MFYLQTVLVHSGTLPLPCYLKTNPVHSPHLLIFSSGMSSLLNNAILLRPCYFITLWLVGFLSTIKSFGFPVYYLILTCILFCRDGERRSAKRLLGGTQWNKRYTVSYSTVCPFCWQKMFFWDLFISTSENKDSYLLRILYFPIESVTRFLVSVISYLLKG